MPYQILHIKEPFAEGAKNNEDKKYACSRMIHILRWPQKYNITREHVVLFIADKSAVNVMIEQCL